MKDMLEHQRSRFGNAFRGIWHAIRTDLSFQIQLWAGAILLILFCVWLWPLTQIELLFLALGWIMILITELQNSSFEAALDRIHPEHNENIGRSKDMAAGSVLLAGLFLLGVMITIACNHLY